jgi:hypothetical protein
MKKTRLAFAVLIVPLVALVAGCAQQSGSVSRQAQPVEQPGATVVNEVPPAPQHQPVPPAPGPAYAYAWIPGYWAWQGHWVWTSGAWVPLPHPHLRWVAGHWVKWGERYKWIPGKWQ